MSFLQKIQETSRKNNHLRLQYGEDLSAGLIRNQVETLKKQLDPSVYRVRSTKKAEKK